MCIKQDGEYLNIHTIHTIKEQINYFGRNIVAEVVRDFQCFLKWFPIGVSAGRGGGGTGARAPPKNVMVGDSNKNYSSGQPTRDEFQGDLENSKG